MNHPKKKKIEASPVDMVRGLTKTGRELLLDIMKRKGVLAEPEVALDRLAICELCESYREDDARCMKCGCFMKAKVRIKSAACTEGKW